MLPKYNNSSRIKSEHTKDSSKYPQGYFKVKACGTCKLDFKPYAPSEKYCTDECKDTAHFKAYLRRNYNITLERYKSMYKSQEGKCKICSGEGFSMSKNKHSVKLVVDHCHETGKVRGLLCHNCNRALGLLKDNKVAIQKALEYLG